MKTFALVLFLLLPILHVESLAQVDDVVGQYYFIMAHDDYHERYSYESRDYPPNLKFIGENYIGFQNSIYTLERGLLKEFLNITELTGRGQHLVHKYLPSFDLILIMTNKLIIYNLGSNAVDYVGLVPRIYEPGRYSRFYFYDNEIYYTNDLDTAFIGLRKFVSTDKDLRSNYLEYISDGNSLSLNLFPFGPNIFSVNDSIYGVRRGKNYPIEKSFSWPSFVTIDQEEGWQKIEVCNKHLLLLVKWLNNENSSTGQYSLYNKLNKRWAQFKLPIGSPIRYQNNWLFGAYYEDESKCITSVTLNENKDPINFDEVFFSRYTLKYGLWPNLSVMYCQHFIYHVDSERMGVVNLDDHDSEILYVFDDKVVYRIYDQILEAPINIVNEEIQVDRRSEKLLVQEKDVVPNIHYMYVK